MEMKIMPTKKQAKKGGELGANGEWYKGGSFINTIPENPKNHQKTLKSSHKQEIEPYVWEVNSNVELNSLYRQLAGIFAKLKDGKMIFCANDQVLKYYNKTQEEIDNMIEKYNNGIRWV